MRRKNSIAIVLSILTTILLVTQVEALRWSVNEKQFTTYTYYDCYPALAQTKDGRIWFAWSKEIGGNLTLYYKISSDQGRTWSGEKNLTRFGGPGENQNPSIIQAQNGTIWVTWASDRPPPAAPPLPDFLMDASPQNITLPQGESGNSTIIVTSINDFSGTVDLSVFNEPTGVSTTLDPTQVAPPANGTANSTLTISVDPTATPGNYTLYVKGRSGKLSRNARVYLEITAVGEVSQTSAGIISHSSSPDSAFMDYEIYYKTSHDNGATWSRDNQLTSNDVDDLCPTFIQLTNGTIMIVWQTHTSGSFEIVYKTTTDGVSWSERRQLTTDPAVDTEPTVTQTKDGKVWVIWASNRYGIYEILYKTYDGVTWSDDLRLTTHTNYDVQPAILQAVDGNIMIFWASGSPTSTYDVYYKYSSNNGTTWSDRIEFAASGYEDMWPAVMRAQDTKILVAWASNKVDQPDGNWEIFYRTSLAGDVNEDGIVNVVDLTIVSLSYGSFKGEPDYNPVADINNDGVVEMRDLRIVAYYLGET